MKATFLELPPFERHRASYLSDEEYRKLQNDLMRHPTAGDVIKGTGGLRKIRYGDPRRGQGKRGGLRVIYYWQVAESQFWLFTVYDKDEMDDLTPEQRKALAQLLDNEIKARSAKNDKA